MPRIPTLEPRITSADVHEALGKRYKDPEYILLREVRNQTGYEKDTSYADAMAFSTWPSRGLEVIGMEIKTARSDWLREKKNPKKAEGIFQYCDKWYLVTPSDVANLDEIPSTYGWLVLKSGRFTIAKEAPMQPLPTAPSRAFMASLLRNAATHSASKVALAAATHAGFEDGRALSEQRLKREFSSSQEDHERLKKVVRDFERVSGVSLNAYGDGANIGAAVNTVLRGGLTHVMHQVEHAKTDLIRQVKALDAFIAANDAALRQKSPDPEPVSEIATAEP